MTRAQPIGEHLREAIRAPDIPRLSRIVDGLRSMGWTYGRIWRLANNVTGVDRPRWDALMEECEDEDASKG